MDNFISVVKGCSASGKSSRVFQVFKFFEFCGIKYKDFSFKVDSKEVVCGIIFEDLNIVFIGKVYESGRVQRWQGYDSVTGRFGNSEGFSNFLKAHSQDFSFIVEGAGVTQTHRLRPKFLYEFCGFENIFIKYYNYNQDQKDIYHKRVVLRSGKIPDKDTMWDKTKAFEREYYNMSLKEMNDLPKNVNCDVDYRGFDEPIWEYGMHLLAFLGYEDHLIMDFVEFTDRFDYINKNKFENFENGEKNR